MKINITEEDYFNELKLMQQQYGQEEDLYPWIYMLLQMTKTEDHISIRTVADGSSAKSVLGRELISGFVAFPDIAILDKNFCSINIDDKKDIACKMDFIKKWLDECIKFKGKVKCEGLEKTGEDLLRKSWYLYNIDKIKGCVEVKKMTGKLFDIPENTSVCFEKNNNAPVVNLNNEEKTYFLTRKEKGEITNKASDEGELFGELLWYGKVLYTNGLVWKFLKVTKCENNDKGVHNIIDLRNNLYENCIEGKNEWYKELSGEGWNIEIECKTIADFGEYSEFKNKKEFNDVKDTWNEQWTKLTDFLENNNWHEDPTSPITTK